ncbi:MAG: mechanosensitive ion channel family protein [Mycobacterium sp.]
MIAELLGDPWFVWAVAVAVGLPVLLVALTEIQHALVRRDSVFVRPVALIRNYILPLGALLLLLIKGSEVSAETTPVRIVATVLGFVVVVVLLSGLNATLFRSAPEGSWRKRIPTIFLDVARFALIAVGLAVILSYVWGANVGGLFTALGVTSIVLGLALQNAVGQVISGLLLLFEQPFQLGDWIDTPSSRGRVVEVNWRATHIDTGSGLQIMPNSVLAGASFTNLSRPPGAHTISVETVFDSEDPPDDVCGMLTRIAGTLPQLKPGARASAVTTGTGKYSTTIPLRSPSDDRAARTTFLRWIWYASRRAGLHLDEAWDDFSTPERVATALRFVAPTLRLTPAEQDELAANVRVVRYGAEETIQFPGQVPKRMTFVVRGRVRLTATSDDGLVIPVQILTEGDFLGQTALTREPVSAGAHAVEEVTALQINRVHLEKLVETKPVLLHDIGRAIEERRTWVRRALDIGDD